MKSKSRTRKVDGERNHVETPQHILNKNFMYGFEIGDLAFLGTRYDVVRYDGQKCRLEKCPCSTRQISDTQFGDLIQI